MNAAMAAGTNRRRPITTLGSGAVVEELVDGRARDASQHEPGLFDAVEFAAVHFVLRRNAETTEYGGRPCLLLLVA